MDDEEYAAALLAILGNPHPTGIDPADPYGTADDGIDRYDGFGRDVVVESATVVPGEHGPEVALGFALRGRLPDGTPRRGTATVPVEREWRRLSGLEDPAAYAPEVAAQVLRASGELVQAHLDPTTDDAPTPPPRDVQWRLLLEALSEHGEVSELGPGRLQVRDPGGATRFTVLLTPDQWEQTWGRHTDGSTSLYVDELLSSADEDEAFVVPYRGDLRTSTREKLPPVRGRALERRLRALRDDTPGADRWSAGPGL